LFPYFSASAQDQPEVTPEARVDLSVPATQPSVNPFTQPTGDNGYCAVCHNQPWRAVTLTDGSVLNLYASPDIIRNSVHGDQSSVGPLGCLDCHGENAFPHDGPTPNDARTYALQAVQMCTRCHTAQALELATGRHEQAIAAGDLNAAVCTDCHGAHDVTPASNQPQLVAGVCGDCHTSTLDEWRSSAHVEIGPLGCGTCHSPHSQQLRATDTDALCLNCHKAPSEIYAHTQHINSPADVKCVDCHMFRVENTQQPVLVSLMPTGHSMTMNTQPCNTCHEELEVTGRWAELTRSVEQQIMNERDALEKKVMEPESELSSAESAGAQAGTSGISFIQLIQGLIIGQGLGITAAVILIPRFVRGSKRRETEANE
jgi:predicted CXXCH cytochrome family protein